MIMCPVFYAVSQYNVAHKKMITANWHFFAKIQFLCTIVNRKSVKSKQFAYLIFCMPIFHNRGLPSKIFQKLIIKATSTKV